MTLTEINKDANRIEKHGHIECLGIKLLSSSALTNQVDTELSAYEEKTLSLTFVGALAAGVTVSVRVRRVGNWVTITYPIITASSDVAAKFTLTAVQFPARFWPAVTQTFSVPVLSTSTRATGLLTINTDGTWTISASVIDGNFAGSSATATAYGTSVTYSTV